MLKTKTTQEILRAFFLSVKKKKEREKKKSHLAGRAMARVPSNFYTRLWIEQIEVSLEWR